MRTVQGSLCVILCFKLLRLLFISLHWLSSGNKLFELVQATFENSNEICFAKLLLDYVDARVILVFFIFQLLRISFSRPVVYLARLEKKAGSWGQRPSTLLILKKETLAQVLFPTNFAKFSRTPFLQNTS